MNPLPGPDGELLAYELFLGLASGNPEAVRQALANGADVNARAPEGMQYDGATPLFVAVERLAWSKANLSTNYLEITQILLGAGVDLETSRRFNSCSGAGWI